MVRQTGGDGVGRWGGRDGGRSRKCRTSAQHGLFTFPKVPRPPRVTTPSFPFPPAPYCNLPSTTRPPPSPARSLLHPPHPRLPFFLNLSFSFFHHCHYQSSLSEGPEAQLTETLPLRLPSAWNRCLHPPPLLVPPSPPPPASNTRSLLPILALFLRCHTAKKTEESLRNTSRAQRNPEMESSPPRTRAQPSHRLPRVCMVLITAM